MIPVKKIYKMPVTCILFVFYNYYSVVAKQSQRKTTTNTERNIMRDRNSRGFCSAFLPRRLLTQNKSLLLFYYCDCCQFTMSYLHQKPIQEWQASRFGLSTSCNMYFVFLCCDYINVLRFMMCMCILKHNSERVFENNRTTDGQVRRQ